MRILSSLHIVPQSQSKKLDHTQKTPGVKEVIGIMGDFWRLFLKRELSQKNCLS
jgi:hypothetical protein